MERTLIANATILDGSGADPFPGDVLVEGQRIAAVKRGGGLPHGDARVIDGAGATLMPGLIESHAHIGLADLGSNDLTRLPVEEHMLVTVRNAKTMLECGYTSAFSAASAAAAQESVARLEPVFEARLISYLRTTGLRAGILMNFNAMLLKDGLKRIVL